MAHLIRYILVAVAVETKGRACGRIRLSIIKDASANSLHPFIINNIKEYSQLITDNWSGYSDIGSKNYTRKIYKQSTAQNEEETLPHVHLVISLLKRWMLGTHQGAIRSQHLQAYLDEFVFRFNRRNATKRGLLFYRLLENAVQTPPSTYGDIVYGDTQPFPDMLTSKKQIATWTTQRNLQSHKVNWQFTTVNARIKLKRLYPTII